MTEYPAIITPDLIEILGRPNFACAELAEGLRQNEGLDIPRKSEAEQAYVIHWMLRLYLEHGDDWRERGAHILERWANTAAAKT